jgi:hypothetical protein
MERVVRFLYGLRDEDVALALVTAGMRDEDVERGWTLMRASCPRSIEAARAAPDLNGARDAREALRRWTGRWVPIIKVALRPAYGDALRLLLERPFQEIDEPVLDAQQIVHGLRLLEGESAREKLRGRGLDEEEVARARELIVRVTALAPIDAREGYDGGCGEAESELWEWYLHWARFALTNVRNGRLLQGLGFAVNGALDARVDTRE